MKQTALFILFVLAVIGLLFAVSGTRAPRIPENERHAAITDNVACLSCHGPDREAALKQGHPPKTECLVCHKTKRRIKKA